MKNLIADYHKKKHSIKNRLKEFENSRPDKDIFAELCFCLLTPQSKAVNCDKAIGELKRTGLLFKGTESAIRPKLRGKARFHNKKASYLVAARRLFKNRAGFSVRNRLNPANVFETREWLVKNIKGLGYKEASHFLRNIGLGKDITILDVHILRNLSALGVIDNIPKSLTRKNYIAVESKMRAFAEKTNIPVAELDLLLWSVDTGYIFK